MWTIESSRSGVAAVEAAEGAVGCGKGVGVSAGRLLTTVTMLIAAGICFGGLAGVSVGEGLASDDPLRAHTPMATKSSPTATTPRANHLLVLEWLSKRSLALCQQLRCTSQTSVALAGGRKPGNTMSSLYHAVITRARAAQLTGTNFLFPRPHVVCYNGPELALGRVFAHRAEYGDVPLGLELQHTSASGSRCVF